MPRLRMSACVRAPLRPLRRLAGRGPLIHHVTRDLCQSSSVVARERPITTVEPGQSDTFGRAAADAATDGHVPPDSSDQEVDMDQLLTVKEAAQRLACTEAAIRKWLYQRRLPAVKVGRLIRLRETDLEAMIARGLRSPRLDVPR